MTDYISRADAIEVLQQFAEDEKPTDEMSKQFQQYQRGRHLAFLQAVEEIKALPSAEAEWIPCSERLPEFPFISCDAHGNLHIPQGIFTFEDSRGTWCIDDVYDDKQTLHYGNRIIAWMPLPKPYREEGEK